MNRVSARYLVPSFITVPPTMNKDTIMQKDEELEIEELESPSNGINEGNEDDYKINTMFNRISFFSCILGVNFFKQRTRLQKVISLLIVAFTATINIYFIIYVSILNYRKPFSPDILAVTLGIIAWTLQATLSTLFLAHWQYTGQSSQMIEQIYAANKGAGIHDHRSSLRSIVRSFYIVFGLIAFYKIVLIASHFHQTNVTFVGSDVVYMFGDDRLFFIAQLCHLYTYLCWSVALFVFALFVHSTNYEFLYFNDQINCDQSDMSDDEFCHYLLKLIKTHNRLTECVNRLDKMFNRYAFVMMATIIPTMTFTLFMLSRRADKSFKSHTCFDIFFTAPIVCFCIFSFVSLTSAPSQLHNSIYATKSALCANTQIWFPYRPNVYHSALAFVCHLDQANLGVSIWGFAIVSKPLVLTTLSVMVTCLAMFMQFDDCSNGTKR